MKRKRILAVLLGMLLLAGCAKTDHPHRVDTVVRIPVNPTEAAPQTEPAEQPATEVPAESAEPTEITEETQPPKTSADKKPSTTKKPSSEKKQESPKPTEQGSTTIIIGISKETEPEVTEAAATIPPTEIPETVPPTEPPFDPSSYNPGSLDYAVLEELNAHRAEAGLEALVMNSRLCGIAALRAREAAELWSHTRPDGRDYTSAMSDYGYGFSVSSENLAAVSGSSDAAAVVSKWMNTDSKKNILSDSFTTAGIGVYRSGGVTYVVNLLVG